MICRGRNKLRLCCLISDERVNEKLRPILLAMISDLGRSVGQQDIERPETWFYIFLAWVRAGRMWYKTSQYMSKFETLCKRLAIAFVLPSEFENTRGHIWELLDCTVKHNFIRTNLHRDIEQTLPMPSANTRLDSNRTQYPQAYLAHSNSWCAACKMQSIPEDTRSVVYAHACPLSTHACTNAPVCRVHPVIWDRSSIKDPQTRL